MQIIFLDDDERRHEHIVSMFPWITQAYSADEAIEIIKRQDKIDYLFLDHDLGGRVYVDSDDEEGTGMTVAKWLAKNKSDIGTIVLHTWNPVGGQNMYSALKDIYNVRIVRYFSHEFNSLLVSIKESKS